MTIFLVGCDKYIFSRVGICYIYIYILHSFTNLEHTQYYIQYYYMLFATLSILYAILYPIIITLSHYYLHKITIKSH